MYMEIEEENGKYYAVHVSEYGETEKLSIGLRSEIEALKFIEKLHEVYDE